MNSMHTKRSCLLALLIAVGFLCQCQLFNMEDPFNAYEITIGEVKESYRGYNTRMVYKEFFEDKGEAYYRSLLGKDVTIEKDVYFTITREGVSPMKEVSLSQAILSMARFGEDIEFSQDLYEGVPLTPDNYLEELADYLEEDGRYHFHIFFNMKNIIAMNRIMDERPVGEYSGWNS